MNGGQDGSRNYVEFIHDDGRREILGKCARYMLKRGEVARLHTATGGGYGPPSRRPREKVLQDLKEGYITPEQAAQDYGVAAG
jgi:N-methylhydantoinase B